MKTTYYLVTTAAVAVAAMTVYAQLPNLNGPLPVAASTSPPPEVPRLALPPVAAPPDEPLVLPGVAAPPSGLPALPTTDPVKPLVPPPAALPPVPGAPAVPPALPPVPVPAALPELPPVKPVSVNSEPQPEPVIPPVPPLALPVPKPAEVPQSPVPTVPPLAVPPALPPTPAPTPASKPAEMLVPPPAPLPVPTPVLQPPVQAAPTPVPNAVVPPARVPADAPAGSAKYVVLKDDRLVEGSAVTTSGDVVVVRQGALDRPFSKSQVQYVAESKDEVYRFMLAKVPATDTAARLKVARWLMFSGLREQALVEAREVRKIEPQNGNAADLVRSLERSLEAYPPDGAPRMTAPEKPTFPAELKVVPPAVEPEADVTPEAAALFATKVQPFLANQCVDCHAKPDHAGAFKLARVAPGEWAQQATRTNLRAVAGRLRKDEPASSPLLLKTLVAHGGQKLPAVASRKAVAYQTLEAWAALAVGTPVAAPPAALPPAPPIVSAMPVVAPPVTAPVLPPVADPVLPPAPATGAVPVPPLVPTIPAAPAIPMTPTVPVVPPVVEPPLPVPLPTVPAGVPPIPPADPLVAPTAPLPKPVVPPIPPAGASAPVPLPPVQPASGFGSELPPKPPVSGPAGGDEFDPAGFNRPK